MDHVAISLFFTKEFHKAHAQTKTDRCSGVRPRTTTTWTACGATVNLLIRNTAFDASVISLTGSYLGIMSEII